MNKSVLKTMPQEIINYIAKNFDFVYSSPYSSSFYSQAGQSWDYTPENQIRIADHWNFWSKDYNDRNSELKQHAVTNVAVYNNSHWTIAKKNNATGEYEVILSLPKREVLPKEYSKGKDLLASKKPNEIYFKKLEKNRQKEALKISESRAKKMKNETLWINFDRVYTERISATKYNTVEELNEFAILVGETADFITIKYRPSSKSTFRFKKSTLKKYKELAKKPTFKD